MHKTDSVREDAIHDHGRDRITIASQEAFRESIATPQPATFDEIDELVEELRSITGRAAQ